MYVLPEMMVQLILTNYFPENNLRNQKKYKFNISEGFEELKSNAEIGTKKIGNEYLGQLSPSKSILKCKSKAYEAKQSYNQNHQTKRHSWKFKDCQRE